MPKGLKATSSQIAIGFDVTTTNPTSTDVKEIELTLNALDNEVFVVTGIKMDLEAPDLPNLTGAAQNIRASVSGVVAKQDPTGGNFTLSSSNVLATAKDVVELEEQGSPSFAAVAATFQENATDTPSQMEYIDIIATSSFYAAVLSANNTSNKTVTGKLYGYRARADASVYAALVQSELLSA
tara:strand:- start:131 stop:676 length:546 start_codon:yes stop_codon:yes gene_type:complete